MSHHEGRLTGKGTIGKKAITPDLDLFRRAHFHVLQQMSIVSKYLDEHKEVLRWLYPENDESSESRMPSMRMNLISSMRFLLSSPR
jgi:hypothetical protein